MNRLITYLNKSASIYPLVTLRILFGGIMFIGVLRFLLKGWVKEFYLDPKFHFTYFGFAWVKPLGEIGMYAVFIIMAMAFLFIALGAFYRISAIIAFTLFTYVELLDKTFYLNHYYFVSLLTFLLIFVPANRFFSIDGLRNPHKTSRQIPNWCIELFKWQLIIVYFYAGFNKLNADWLINAMPLKIWLKAFIDLPLIGDLFKYDLTAYLFSWGGALYDLTIPFLLLSRRFRSMGYFMVVIFHLLTALMFPIGMFPFIMIACTLIFLPPSFHDKLWLRFSSKSKNPIEKVAFPKYRLLPYLLGLYFLIQITVPLRSYLYSGNLFWTEQGYRFSWRVMLMEKAAYAIFQVSDSTSNRKWEARISDFLTPAQEKMMSTQPDMILQFVNFLHEYYKENDIPHDQIKVQTHATLNGSRSKLLIDPKVNLLHKKESFLPKKWILPFENS